MDFIIEVGKEQFVEEPSSDKKLQPNESSKVTQIFNTTIYGGAANIVGKAENSSIEINITTGDFNSLRKLLIEKGVDDADLDELEKAVEQDDKPSEKGRFGTKVSHWISKMVEKASNGSWQIGIGVAANLLSNAISKFYGL